MRIKIAAVVLLALGCHVSASDFDFVTNQMLADVASDWSLKPSDDIAARRVTAAWFYLGPCMGDVKDIPADLNGMASILLTHPGSPIDRAVLEMIATLVIPTMGRPIPKDGPLCHYAHDVAVSRFGH